MRSSGPSSATDDATRMFQQRDIAEVCAVPFGANQRFVHRDFRELCNVGEQRRQIHGKCQVWRTM
jgi:hypothetical protein